MKETLKGKVTKAERYEPNGKPYQDKNGNYYFNVVFENGDKGSYCTKRDIQDKFVVGQEAEYEKEENGAFPDGTPKFKIRVPKPAWTPGGGGGSSAKWQPKSTREYKAEAVNSAMIRAVEVIYHLKDREFKDLEDVYQSIRKLLWDSLDELGE